MSGTSRREFCCLAMHMDKSCVASGSSRCRRVEGSVWRSFDGTALFRDMPEYCKCHFSRDRVAELTLSKPRQALTHRKLLDASQGHRALCVFVLFEMYSVQDPSSRSDQTQMWLRCEPHTPCISQGFPMVESRAARWRWTMATRHSARCISSAADKRPGGAQWCLTHCPIAGVQQCRGLRLSEADPKGFRNGRTGLSVMQWDRPDVSKVLRDTKPHAA